MKKIENIQASVSSGKLTLTADVVDAHEFEYKFPGQNTTVVHVADENPRHHRHVQVTNKGVFVKAYGNGFFLPLDTIVAIAAKIEPKTSYAPKLKTLTAADLTIQLNSELQPDFQWQESNKIDATATWANVEGQITKTLDKTKVKAGQWVRCIASSEAGQMISNPVQIK